MTKPNKYDYLIQYNDDKYRVVKWTRAEFKQVGEAIVEAKRAIALEKGIFVLYTVKAIVELEPMPTEPEPEKRVGEYDGYDFETRQWLAENGIDIVNGGIDE